MGFDIHACVVIDGAPLPAYDRIVPGAAAYAIRVHAPNLPTGWFLPLPWVMDDRVPDWQNSDWFSDRPQAKWREKLACPSMEDPEEAFDLDDFRFASIMSLIAPSGAVLIIDSTHGGVLSHEYACAFVAGTFHHAAGVDFVEKRSYRWDGTAYAARDGIEGDSSADCLALIDSKFEGADLFSGYLPRSDDEAGYDKKGPVPGPIELPSRTPPEWREWFPILKGNA